MTRSELLQGIQDVAENHLDFQGQLTEASTLVEALRLDSIRMLTLVVELENRFAICLEEGDEDGLVQVGQLIDILEQRGA